MVKEKLHLLRCGHAQQAQAVGQDGADAVGQLQAGGQEAAELFQAFLKFVGDILRFLEEHGLSKQIVDAIFQLILKIFGAA